MGRRYVIDHVVSALNNEEKRKSYEFYVTEALQAIVHNTARQETVMTLKSYRDLTAPKAEVDEEKEAEKIINHIRNKLEGG